MKPYNLDRTRQVQDMYHQWGERVSPNHVKDVVRFIDTGKAGGSIGLKPGERAAVYPADRRQQVANMHWQGVQMQINNAREAAARNQSGPPGPNCVCIKGNWMQMGPGQANATITYQGSQYRLSPVYFNGGSLPGYNAVWMAYAR